MCVCKIVDLIFLIKKSWSKLLKIIKISVFYFNLYKLACAIIR